MTGYKDENGNLQYSIGVTLAGEYDGHRFCSRLEVRWAVFFNAIGLTYEYEIEGFEMDVTRYFPDFYISSLNRWFEIKGKLLEYWSMSGDDRLKSILTIIAFRLRRSRMFDIL